MATAASHIHLPSSMRRPGAWLAGVLGLLGVLTGPVSSTLPASADEGQAAVVSLIVENDLIANTDRHYTSGVRATWLRGADSTPDWTLRAARWLPLFPQEGSVRTEYALGQSMFTASDIRDEDPPQGERPYAGWLYGSIGLVAETGLRLDQLQLTIGMVGPASLAGETQRIVHRITGSRRPRGWDTQLKNEPGVVLTYQRSWREFISESVAGFGVDVTPHAGAALGNVFTYANAGVMLRFGANLPRDYGPPRVPPGLPGSGFFVPPLFDRFGWYLFAGAEGRVVARNIFLDGNTFRRSRSVDKVPLVADVQFGAALTWRNLRLSYTHVLRTREFKGQGDRDNFGAFSLSLRF